MEKFQKNEVIAPIIFVSRDEVFRSRHQIPYRSTIMSKSKGNSDAEELTRRTQSLSHEDDDEEEDDEEEEGSFFVLCLLFHALCAYYLHSVQTFLSLLIVASPTCVPPRVI